MPSWNELFYQYGALHGTLVVVYGETYRLFTSMFLHSNAMHMVMNMLSLYMVGRMVERLFKSWAYLSLYFISGLFGSFAYMYMSLFDSAVGASGAIFGIFGALAGFAWVHRNSMQRQFMQFMRDFGIILVINFFIGIIFPSIAMSAHIGGLIAGVIGGMIIAKSLNYIWAYIGGSLLILIGFYNYLQV